MTDSNLYENLFVTISKLCLTTLDKALSINDFSSLFSTLIPSLTSVAKRRVASRIYALFLKTKTLILPVYARLYARLTPVFLLKKCPSFARLFSNMGSSEEFGTLIHTCCR